MSPTFCEDCVWRQAEERTAETISHLRGIGATSAAHVGAYLVRRWAWNLGPNWHRPLGRLLVVAFAGEQPAWVSDDETKSMAALLPLVSAESTVVTVPWIVEDTSRRRPKVVDRGAFEGWLLSYYDEGTRNYLVSRSGGIAELGYAYGGGSLRYTTSGARDLETVKRDLAAGAGRVVAGHHLASALADHVLETTGANSSLRA